MIWDRTGNPNADREGPCWASVQCRQEATAGRGEEGVFGQSFTCSFTTQADVRMARLPLHDIFNLVFIPEHRPWQQTPTCSACAGGVCPIGRAVALDQPKALEAREKQLLWD